MYSKTTENLKLPLWTWEDHPDFITDLNYENRILDEAFKEHTDDYETLREQVLTTVSKLEEMEVEFGSIKEKVDQLTDLDENPIFVRLSDRVTITETNIANLTGRMTDAEKELEEHETSINTLTLQMKTAKEDIEQLGTDLSDLEATVSALENTVNGHTTELTEIHSSISAIEERLDSIDTSVGNVNTSITQLANQVGSLQSAVNKNTTDIKVIQADYVDTEKLLETKAELEDAIHDQSVQDRIESDEKYATTESVDQIEAKNTEQDTAIAGLQTEQSSLDMRVEALEDKQRTYGTTLLGSIKYSFGSTTSGQDKYILFVLYSDGTIEIGAARIDVPSPYTFNAIIPDNVTVTQSIYNYLGNESALRIIGNPCEIQYNTVRDSETILDTMVLFVNFTGELKSDVLFSTLSNNSGEHSIRISPSCYHLKETTAQILSPSAPISTATAFSLNEYVIDEHDTEYYILDIQNAIKEQEVNNE